MASLEVLYEPIDDEHTNGNGEHVESGGDGLSGDLFEDGKIGDEFAGGNFLEELGFLEAKPEVDNAAEVNDEGGEGESGDAQFGNAEPTEDEERIEDDVSDESRDEIITVGNGVALG